MSRIQEALSQTLEEEKAIQKTMWEGGWFSKLTLILGNLSQMLFIGVILTLVFLAISS